MTGDPAELIALAEQGGPDARRRLVAAVEAVEFMPTTDVDHMSGQCRRLADLARRLGQVSIEKRVELRLAVIHHLRGDLATAMRRTTELTAWAAENDDDDVLCRCHFYLATFFREIGDSAQSLEHGVLSLRHTPEDAPPMLRARHLEALGMALGISGHLEEERRRYAEALEIASDISAVGLSLQLLNGMAFCAYESGDEAAAVAHIARMRATAERHGVDLDHEALDTIARIEMMRGRFDVAEDVLSPLTGDSPGIPVRDPGALLDCLRTLAEAQRARGALDRARSTLDAATAMCERLDLASARVPLRQERAALYAAMGRYREAYEEHTRFYEESETLRASERAARAQAMHVVYETHEARRASQQFRDLALRDPLTDLPNRRFVNERLPQLLAGSADRPLSAALIDLDHFKRINDTLSHDAGDAVLVAVARLLTDAIAEPAFAARMGGEEFLVVLPDTDSDAAVLFCDKLRGIVQGHDWQPVTGDLPVTASLGVTTCWGGEITPAALLSEADRNLYAAKRTGRNRVVADRA